MTLLARGQITIRSAADNYAVYQSVDKTAFSCDHTGKTLTSFTVNSVISVRCGDNPVTNFTIGAIVKPTGFSAITINQSTKTISYTVSGGDTTLADTGTISVPITVDGQTFTTSFGWYKVKAGTPGTDSNLLDWVSDWNSGKTVIDSQNVITPKIFAGTKNGNGTVTGTAIGKFALKTRNASGVIATEPVNGIYGFYEGNKTFEINAAGSVQLGNGNEYIRYNSATGKVEFGSAVSLNWIGSTFINSTGVFTGTLSANTVNAVRLNASQITAGTIDTNRLDAAGIKTNIINTNYINGLSCTFIQGKIGGFTIGANDITSSGLNTVGATPLQIRSASSGSGFWFTGSYRPFGVSMIWFQPNNAGHIVFGEIAASGSTVRAGFVGIQMMSWDGSEYFCLSANYTISGVKEVYNRIAGWAFDSQKIWKNNVLLGADGSIYNGTKWRLNNDGSGQLANGNIAWNSVGNVTFGASVSLQWKNDIEDAKTANYGYRYSTDVYIYGDSDKYYPVVIKAGEQTVLRDILVRRRMSEQAPSDWSGSPTHIGSLILHIKANFGSWGGVDYSWDIYQLSEAYCRMFAGAVHCGNYCMFAIFLRGGGETGAVYHLYSDQPLDSSGYSEPPVPPSPQICYNGEQIFLSASFTAYAPAPRTLTPLVEEEIRRHRFIALAQGNDSTLMAHPLTYIGSTGIYTGTLTANQITAGTIHADRIATGSITSGKLDAASIKADLINAAYINGLNCTFTKGTIGGWTIGENLIAASGTMPGHKVCITNSGHIYNNDGINDYWGLRPDGSAIFSKGKIGFNADGSGSLAGGNIVWDTAGNVTFGSSVALNWTSTATNALNEAKLYADKKKTDAVNEAARDATYKADSSKELASAMAFGKMLYRDPTFYVASNGVVFYNSLANGMVTISRISMSAAPNESKFVLEIRNKGAASPDCGGFTFGTMASYRKVFITRFIAKIPFGRIVLFGAGSVGTDGSSKWLTPNVGTGDWAEYVYKVTCGTNGFSTINSFYIEGTATLNWYIAYATVFDVTSTEKYTTTIDADGIYTSTLNANQITAGTIHADRIAAGSITSGKLDAASIQANIINTTYINGLRCVFTKGSIGGWTISANSITASSAIPGHSVCINSAGYIYNREGSTDYWALKPDGSAVFGKGKIGFNADGSGTLAGGNISWDTVGNVTAKGGIFSNIRIHGSLRNKFILNNSSIWVETGTPVSQENFTNYDNIVAIRGQWDEDIPLLWTLDQSGRRLTLVNYKWRTDETLGYMSITAPPGKYFYEDGIAKSSIRFNREMIELMGYGDDQSFYGWIVTNRLNLMTSEKYGCFQRVLAQGVITMNNTTAQYRYQTFDGGVISVNRTGMGQYTVTLPWNLELKYFVQLTGYYTNNAPIYATIKELNGTYFKVQTQDDDSANEGSFCFQVFSMADWGY